MRTPYIAANIVTILCVLSVSAFAQVEPASLGGTVTDDDGDGLANVTVEIINSQAGTYDMVVSDSNGR